MTISSVVPVNNYLGNGSTTTFDFDFLIESGSELVVTKTDAGGNIVTLTENLDYSIHETGNNNGSYITFPIASSGYSVLTSSEVLTLSLDLDIKQESSFPTDIKLSLPVIERTFDYIVRLIQILNRKLERAIKVKESPTIDTEALVNNIDKIGLNLPTLTNINNNISNINAVNSNETNINTVSGIDDEIIAVSEITSDVSTVAGMSSSISACVTNMTDINNAASNAQTASDKADEASASASSALGSENLAKDWANKIGSTVDGNEYSAKHYALQARDDSSASYIQLMANLGYERKELISDENLYRDVNKYAHSTFDSSKFTATGTPTIADGIASGFSDSNYLIANQTIDFTKPFRIVYNEKRGTATKFNGFHVGVSGSVSTALLFVQASNATVLTLGLYIGGTLTVNDYDFAHGDYTDINYIVSWNGTNYSIEVRNAISHETIMSQTVESSTAIENSSSSTGVLVYGYNFNNAVAIQSTDLKKTSFENGSILFSGNRTGTDIIISNNYTVVGSPTITDGVASGFSSSNYLTKTLNIPAQSGNKIVVEAVVNFAILPTGENKNIFAIRNYDNSRDLLYVGNTTGGPVFRKSWQRTQNSSSSGSNSGLISVGNNCFRAIMQNGNIKIYTGSSFENLTLRNNDTFYDGGISVINIGTSSGATGTSTSGSIPLTYFKVIINDKIVYTPYLAVPYTESSTGSKVVDVAYFDRVQTVYDLNGKALYYVIDTKNKKSALPFGEIYGLISTSADDKQIIGDWCKTTPTTTSSATNNKPAVLIENYKNGIDQRIKFSDGTVIIRGHCDSTSEINLPYTMADTDYIVLSNRTDTHGNVVKFTKTTTSITPSYNWDSDYCVIGYAVMS